MILDELYESQQICPECGGPAFSDLLLAEKKDACYHKVRSRYKVWPSAYASGALVQCRKKGAANWGNKSEGVAEGANVTSQIKRIKDRILQLKDWNTAGTHDKKIKELQTKLKELQSQKQGVAEGINDDFEQAHHNEVERYITVYGTPGEYRHKYDAMGRAHNSYLTYPGRTVTINTQQYGDRFGHNVFTKKEQDVSEEQLDEKCWDTHKQVGMKKKGDRMVPNCVPREGVSEGADRSDMVGFHLDSEQAYNAVMSRFGDMIDHDEDSGIMYAPERIWPKIELVAFDADGIGAQRDDEIENPEHYGLDEGEKVGHMDADQFDAAMARLKQLAGAGPLKTVWDPQKRVYRNVPVAQQPKQQPSK